MRNITSSMRKREITGKGINLEARELFDEINGYLPILRIIENTKVGPIEELIDNLTRAVMIMDEGEIFLSLSEILTHRTMNSTEYGRRSLSQEEKDRLKGLTDLLTNFIKDPDYLWSIDNQIGLIDRLEYDSDDFAELLEQYDEEELERYAEELELEYDGHSTD